jgi:hypothetical protein
MIRWLERHLGRYPFDRVGAVLVPTWSAMETQTLVTMGTPIISDPREFAAVLVHEYAHQWYGDTVTPDNWKDLWLTESFAMYTQIRWEVSRGWATMRQWRRLLYDLDAEMRAEDGPPGGYRKTRFASSCVYYCGALMLDRLRAKVGDRAFADLWRAWPQRHRDGNADRADDIAWASRRSGRDLEPFLTRWLTSARTPRPGRRSSVARLTGHRDVAQVDHVGRVRGGQRIRVVRCGGVGLAGLEDGRTVRPDQPAPPAQRAQPALELVRLLERAPRRQHEQRRVQLRVGDPDARAAGQRRRGADGSRRPDRVVVGRYPGPDLCAHPHPLSCVRPDQSAHDHRRAGSGRRCDICG